MNAAPRRSRIRTLATIALGAAIGATTSAGIALLLYTGQGFVRAAGLLFASTILALGAGLWAGTPDAEQTPRSAARWFVLVLTLLLGGTFTVLWSARGDIRALAIGGALAVMLVLAMPAYSAGAVLAAIQARRGHRSVAAAALTGGAIGVLLTTMVLIQNQEPFVVYHGAAALLLLLGLAEARAQPSVTHGANPMNGKVAIITGVSDRGQLGFVIAHKFLDAGAAVVITGRTAETIALAAELAPAERVAAVPADLTNDEAVARLIDTARARFGRLDALINVAGGLTVIASVAETTPEMLQRELQRNAETVLRTSRAALPLLRETRGAIVNFAAPAGERAAANLSAYSAAKAAVIALTRALALEEKAHGVRVNAIAPGLMDTAQNLASAEEGSVFVPRGDVAEVALFLAGQSAAGITGDTIYVLGETLS